MNPIDCYYEIASENRNGEYKKALTFEQRLKHMRRWFLKDQKRKANNRASYLKRKKAKLIN